MVTRFFAFATVVFIVFRILNAVKYKLPVSQKIKEYVNNLLPVAELMVWVALVVWVAWKVYGTGNYFALVSIAILFLLSVVPVTFLLRDFVAGFYLRMQNKINTGSYVETEGIKGEIKRAGPVSLDIIDSQGNICSVGYYKIRSKVIKKQGDNQHLEKIQLVFAFDGHKKANEIVPVLQAQVMSTPWVAVSQKPW
ncbi:MAG: mechanosensitive ion channel [Bacteroidales bacterium]|nr:mechanosensitive ion channel [Bacteroidales bacterium]